MRIITVPTLELAQLNAGDLSCIEGEIPFTHHYVDGQFVELPARPNTLPGQQYEFDYTTKTWILVHDVSHIMLRKERNILLSAVDRVNPVWYNSLTQEQQQELQTYRQALLDVPGQAGFPDNIDWPVKPIWL